MPRTTGSQRPAPAIILLLILGIGPIVDAGPPALPGPPAGADLPPQRLPHVEPGESSLAAKLLPQIGVLIEAGMSRGDLPGAVVLIAHRGRIELLQAWGRRTVLPEPTPMTVDTVFDLASLTKPVVTSTSIMQLVEQGRIRLDDPVSRHVPEFAAQGKEAVTVEQLLLHTGGLIADNSLADYEGSREDCLQRICQLPLVNPPGEKFVYSDVGFLALGMLVERAAGQPLDEFARESFLAPLGMADTGFRPSSDLRPRTAPTEREGAEWLNGVVHDPRARRMAGVAGHAGLFSTAEDLAVFGQMVLNHGEYGGRRVLQAPTCDEWLRPRDVPGGGRRALGWDVQTGYSRNRGTALSPAAVGHGGFTGTVLWIDPERELVFVFLSSRLHPDGEGQVNGLSGEILDAVAAELDAPSG